MEAPGWLFGAGSTPRARRGLLLVNDPALILAGTLRFDFVFDDNLVVLGDRLVTGQFNLREIFGSEVRVEDVTLGYYRPLVTLLYRADRALWGTGSRNRSRHSARGRSRPCSPGAASSRELPSMPRPVR